MGFKGNILPSLLSLFAAVPIVLILIAQANPHILPDFWFLKVRLLHDF